MNAIDRVIRHLRISQAIRHIRPGSRVLDVGCHDGELFRRLGPGLREGFGMDPALAGALEGDRYRLEPGAFPGDCSEPDGGFDAITILAVLEHIPSQDQLPMALTCYTLLKPGGVLILTVPSPKVDAILEVLQRLRIIDGMETEQHHGFDPAESVPLMEKAGFRLQLHKPFQFKLNNLYVFQRP